MHDGGKIIIGIIIFLLILAVPIWYNAVKGKASYTPEVVVETEGQPGRDQCVLPADRMKTEHMDLVMDWRDQVVRENDRVYTAFNGKRYEKSLTNTCLDCHSNRDQFCDRCHNYTGVDPYCWDCHVVPGEVE